MSARKALRQQSGWSTALRDDDDDDDSEPDTATTPSSTRTARIPEATHDTPAATPAYREGSDWDWNWAGDAVDIGLVPEPKELKFTETPFTLAKRNAKPVTASAITKSTMRSAPPAQGPNRKLDDNSERANKGRPVQSSPSKPPRSPPIRQPLRKGLKATTLGSRATPSSSEPHAVPHAPASSASNKQALRKADKNASQKKASRPTAESRPVPSKSDSRSNDPKASAPHSSGFRPAKLFAGTPAPAQSTRTLPPQQVKVSALPGKAAWTEGQDRDAIRQQAVESASSHVDSPSSRRDDQASDQAELFETTLPSSEADLPDFLRSPTPAFQDPASHIPIARPARSNESIMHNETRPIRPVPFKPFVPPLRHDPASLVNGASLAKSPAAFARSHYQAQAQAHAQSTPSVRIETTSFYSKPESAASSPVRPVRAVQQQQQHKQGISPETRKRLDRFKRIGNFGLVGETSRAADPVPAESQLPGPGPAQTAAAGPAAPPSSTRFTIPGLSTPLADATKKSKRTSRLAFQPDEPLEAFQARSGLKPFSSLGGGGNAHATASSGSGTLSAASQADPASPTPSIDYQRTGRETIILGATVRSVRPVTFSGVQDGGSGPSHPSNARGKKGFKRPLPAAKADWEADYGLTDAGVPSESEDAKRRRLYRSLGL